MNTVCEPTTFGFMTPDIMIKIVEITGVRNNYWEEWGLLSRSRFELLGRAVSSVTDVLEEYT
jgi:hypothetical protein